MKKMKTLFKKSGISITFFLIIIIFLVSGRLLQTQSFSLRENRVLQQKPTFTMANFINGNYQKDMETYLNDQFLGRSTFVAMKTKLEHKLGKDNFQDIIIGKDDELFQNIPLPTPDVVTMKSNCINTFVNAHENITFSMIIAPNKASILGKKLPESSQHLDQKEVLANFQKQLATRVSWIDAYSVLSKLQNEDIYYRSDHHWTTKGAHSVFSEWEKTMFDEVSPLTYTSHVIANDFLGSLANASGYYEGKKDAIEIYTSEDEPSYIVQYEEEKTKSTSLYDVNKAKSANPYDVFLSGNHPLIKINTNVNNTKHLLILKDSYANSMLPFLLPYYNEITIVDARYYYGDIEKLIEERAISDCLFLYNANTFFSDESLQELLYKK
ncbi:MAG: DHHW family protein [Longicatena sp.]